MITDKYISNESEWVEQIKATYGKKKLKNLIIFKNYLAKMLEDNYSLNLDQYITPDGQYDLENTLGIEIKYDTSIEKFGKIYIEYKEKLNNHSYDYINSGILTKNKVNYFLTGTQKKFYIFKKSRLIEILKEEFQFLKKGIYSPRHIMFQQRVRSKGYIYPVSYSKNDTITIEQMIEEIKNNIL